MLGTVPAIDLPPPNMKTKLITRILVACTLVAGLSSSPFLAAATVTYVVDTNLSSVALSGTVSALGITAALNEQSPGSLTAIYGGTLIANVESGSIQFVGGNQLTPLENRSLQPGPGGVAGSAPASYGGKATASLGFFGSVNALVASRQIAFDVSSAPVPLTGTTFQAKSIDYNLSPLTIRSSTIWLAAPSRPTEAGVSVDCSQTESVRRAVWREGS